MKKCLCEFGKYLMYFLLVNHYVVNFKSINVNKYKFYIKENSLIV